MSDSSSDSEIVFNFSRQNGGSGGSQSGSSAALSGGSAPPSSSDSSINPRPRRRLRVVETDSESFTDARENMSPAGVHQSGVCTGPVRRRLPEIPSVLAARRDAAGTDRAVSSGSGPGGRVRRRLPEIPQGAVPWPGLGDRSSTGRRAFNEGREGSPRRRSAPRSATRRHPHIGRD